MQIQQLTTHRKLDYLLECLLNAPKTTSDKRSSLSRTTASKDVVENEEVLWIYFCKKCIKPIFKKKLKKFMFYLIRDKQYNYIKSLYEIIDCS